MESTHQAHRVNGVVGSKQPSLLIVQRKVVGLISGLDATEDISVDVFLFERQQ